jgi:hypothetical protein
MTPNRRRADGDFELRWGRLVDRTLEGGVVPFLGAGVSIEARSNADSAFEPTVQWMQGRLAVRLGTRAAALARRRRRGELRHLLGLLGAEDPGEDADPPHFL